MGWIENTMPPKNVIARDLESRDINASKWWELSKENEKLLHLLVQCYAKHNFGHRHFDEALHHVGVQLRFDKYCAYLLQEYPELRKAP